MPSLAKNFGVYIGGGSRLDAKDAKHGAITPNNLLILYSLFLVVNMLCSAVFGVSQLVSFSQHAGSVL